MSDYRESHQGAVWAAINAVDELQGTFARAMDQCDMTIGAIQAASGSAEVESAVNARSAISECKDRVAELITVAEHAKEELARYGRGF
jgi:hypothetical protein